MSNKSIAIDASLAAIEGHLKNWLATSKLSPKDKLAIEFLIGQLKDSKELIDLTSKVLSGTLSKAQLFATLSGKLVTPFALVKQHHLVVCAAAIIEAVAWYPGSTALLTAGPLGIIAWGAIFIYEAHGVYNSCQPLFDTPDSQLSLNIQRLKGRLAISQEVAKLSQRQTNSFSQLAKQANDGSRRVYRWRVS